MKIAAFCGTFDPVTYGHLDIIERASKLFDELVVFISPNSDKNNEFTEARRLAWLNESTKHLSNVTCKIQWYVEFVMVWIVHTSKIWRL